MLREGPAITDGGQLPVRESGSAAPEARTPPLRCLPIDCLRPGMLGQRRWLVQPPMSCGRVLPVEYDRMQEHRCWALPLDLVALPANFVQAGEAPLRPEVPAGGGALLPMTMTNSPWLLPRVLSGEEV